MKKKLIPILGPDCEVPEIYFGAAAGNESTSTVSIQLRRACQPWKPETSLM